MASSIKTRTIHGRRTAELLMKSARAEGTILRNIGTRKQIERATELLFACLRGGGTVFVCGNGGSAEQAQHFAGELGGRFKLTRRGLPAIALGMNIPMLTAIANDFSYAHVFARELEALGKRGDILFALSTSGNSENVLEAVATAKRLGIITIGLAGPAGKLADIADHAVAIHAPTTARIQEGHLQVIHLLSEFVEDLLFNRGELVTIVERFKGKRVGVVGDVMLDRFIRGEVERISPEAPIPVVLMRHEELSLGGAGNAAANAAAFGGKVTLVGEIGNDEVGRRVLAAMRAQGISSRGIFKSKERPTTEKVRIASGQQQIVRLDREVHTHLHPAVERTTLAFISAELPKWDAVILSDYAKGMLTPRIVTKVIALAKRHGKPVIGDTKPAHFPHFKGVTLVTPNRKEAEEFTGIKLTDHAAVERASAKIQQALGSSVLVTRGPAGMSLFHDKEHTHIPPARIRKVFDVSGAGDTVVATVALALAAGATPLQASELASHAGGISVEKPGTATVSPDELIRAIQWA